MAIIIKYSYRFVCFKCRNVKVEEIELSVNNQSKQITIRTYPKCPMYTEDKILINNKKI